MRFDMQLLATFILLLLVQVSSATLPGSYPINPDFDGVNLGDQGNKPMMSLLFLRGTGTDMTSNGRYIVYVTEHENLTDTMTTDYIVHKYDRVEDITLSSVRIMKNSKKDGASFSLIHFEDESADSILFTHESQVNGGVTSSLTYRYSFIDKEVSIYKSDVETLWSVSPNGQFLKYDKGSSAFTFDNTTNEEIALPVSYALSNGLIVNFEKVAGTHSLDINNQGDMILQADYESKILDGASRFYQYNIVTGNLLSIRDMIPLTYDINITKGTQHSALISNDGKYITLPARNIEGELVILLINTLTSAVAEHKVPFDIFGYGGFLPRLLTNEGLVQYVRQDNGTDTEVGGTEVYVYDFNRNEVIERTALFPEDPNATEFQTKIIDQISEIGDVAIIYDLIMTKVDSDIEFNSTMSWLDLSANVEPSVEIKIAPLSTEIDPYANQQSQFSINVSGSDIYGLDVSCNLSSTSLSVTHASYNGLFDSQNTMELPLIFDAGSVTGAETLVAPELPFTGNRSFVLADVFAEFTTEDVQINCAAEISDVNGQLLQVTLTPATIRIDDGVHGGAGSVSGSIEIPGVTDLSGVEVVLTIDGRQVTVMTDETGRFEFDGLRDGEFTISLAIDNYVQSCQAANVAEGSAVDLGSIELLAGDINADGSIDIADFTFMTARYRSNQGDGDYDAKADLNNDGTINIQDLAILGSHFGSAQCDPQVQ
jgi:hypothetical protein